jgi:predicted lipoprotein with Yx(FWY)xxD motif
MIRKRGWRWTLSALVLTGALLAGCGGGSSSSTPAASDPDTEAAGEGEDAVRAPVGYANVAAKAEANSGVATAPRVAVVGTMTPDPVKVIVDGHGMTAYEFRRDEPMLYQQFTRDPVPTCYDACAATWTPLLTDDAPKAKAGADPSMLGTIKRRDGGTQVTYDEHPLYLFRGDRRPGQMNGQDAHSFGAAWHAVEDDGDVLIFPGG